MKIEKFDLHRAEEPAVIGSTNQMTSASPAPVCVARSGTPSARKSGTALRIGSRTPRPSTTPFLHAHQRRRAAAEREPGDRQEQPAPPVLMLAGGSGRFRIAVTMFMRLTREAENETTARVSSTPTA